LVVGREPTCDLPILDVGVSRRHAEIRAGFDGVEIRDLASRNGTYVNEKRVTIATAVAGDRVAFGGVEMSLMETSDPVRSTPPAAPAFDAGLTMVRERAMPSAAHAINAVAGKRLAQLVSLAKRLGSLTSVSALIE